MDSMAAAFADFLKAYPAYRETQQLDALRAAEYSRLDRLGHVYLDYTGGGLYAESQLERHMALLRDHVFGNPHSANPTSLEITHLVEQARAYVLEYFNAAPDEYAAIFTANASGALKLVGEAYPFGPGAQYLLTFDNHNSVNGIREFSRFKHAQVTYVPICLPDLRVDEAALYDVLDQARPGGHNLFAYPAQSNFSGVQHPLAWIERAHERGWDVLLDAAAFAPTNRLDLGQWKPDFIPLSFYKIFGYPTGVGCLLARRTALAKLQRPWFAGGTITVASVQGDRFYFAEGAQAFEDGTVNYLSLPAVEIGLRHIAGIGIERVHERVRCLTGWLLEQLTALHHSDGTALIRVYGPVDTSARGGTVTMNVFDSHGQYFDHRLIEQAANRAGISLRTGCFCNPGGGEIAWGISKDELLTCLATTKPRLTFDDFRICIDSKQAGAVRVSVGLVSNFADVYRFVQFAQEFVDRHA
jgi:molybdenum cofactor sulfurtransferase